MFNHPHSAILNKSNINLFARTHRNPGFRGHNLPNLEGNTFLRILVLVLTQPKKTQCLLFTNSSPILRTTTQEEAVYLIFDRLLSLGGHFTHLMSTERSCRIKKHAFGLIPILDTITGSREERVFNLLNHMSNEPILWLKICIDLYPHNFQPL